MVIGIVYKFTIIAKVKYNGHKPFYVGQHWCNSEEEFLDKTKTDYYEGSGSMWKRFLIRLKKLNPHNWRMLIKREILYSSNRVSQKALDKLEEYYIKKFKAHYSYGLGGCNILWGTANKFGSGSPMKDIHVRNKVISKLIGKKGAKRSTEGRKNMSMAAKKSWLNAENRRKIISHLVSERMKNGGAEHLSKIRKGIKRSESTRRKMSENHADFSGNKHPLWGSKFIWITNGIVNKRHNPEDDIPNGYYRGVRHKNKIFNHEHNI